MRFYQNGSAS